MTTTTGLQKTEQALPAAHQAVAATVEPVRDYFIKLAGEDRFLKEQSFFAQIVGTNPALQGTSIESKVLAFQALAVTKLTLNPIEKLAYLIPRRGRCVLEPSYMGMVKLLTDTGSVRHIEVRPIYKNDECEIDMASEVKVKRHVPYMMRGLASGGVVAFYSIATLADGAKHFEIMSKADVDAVAARSESVKAKGGMAGTTWGTDYEEMGRKTVIKRHVKHLPKSDRYDLIAKAMDLDNQDFELEANRGYRPQLASAAETEQRAVVDDLSAEVKRLQAACKDALKDYQGEDKAAIRKEMIALAGSGLLDPEKWVAILQRLGGDPAGR